MRFLIVVRAALAVCVYDLNPGFTECGAVYAWTKQHAAGGGR